MRELTEVVDRTISAGDLVAWLLWLSSLALWVASWWFGDTVGRLSIIVAAGAATATVRTYFVRHESMVRCAMAVTSTVTDVASPRRTRRD